MACLLLLLGGWINPPVSSAHHYFFPQVRDRLQQQVEAEIHEQGYTCQGEIICGLQVIPMFYQQRQYTPVWFGMDGLHPTAKALVEAIRRSDQDGLDPSDYHLEAIDRLLEELSAGPFPPDESRAHQWADLDLMLTDALLLLGSHLSGGRINPESLHADWLITPRSLNMLEVLNATADADHMLDALYQLRPAHTGYTLLKSALQHLRRLAEQGGWPRFESDRTLRPGDSAAAAVALRRRLSISGDLQPSYVAEQPDLYDELLAAAVMRFQSRHGLKPDGVIGAKTRDALNIPVTQRIRQIELSLERWRWLPEDLSDRYIMVNTAAFNLKVMEQERKKLEMRVVVGRPARQSPAFSATMTYLVLNPYWTVPRTIAVEDILPKLTEGPDYLLNQNFKVFSGWGEDAVELDPLTVDWRSFHKHYFPLQLRQEPGRHNALGRIKFMFPNQFAVYLHDTPQRSLFNRFKRDFSSGCIRVEDALALAVYLLADDPQWTPEKLNRIFDDGRRQVVHIPRPITIHLQYMTAWVDENGMLQFREDIYQRDRQLSDALNNRRPYPLPPLTIPKDRI